MGLLGWIWVRLWLRGLSALVLLVISVWACIVSFTFGVAVNCVVSVMVWVLVLACCVG